MKKILIPLVLAAAAGAAVWYTYFRQVDTRLILSGSIEARSVEVGSLVGGRIASVDVQEGQQVRAGQPVVTFEADLLDPQIREQQAQIGQAKAVLDRVRIGPRQEEVAQLRIEWENAETEHKRMETLFKGGAISKSQADTAETRAGKALEALRAAQRGGTVPDVSAQKAAVQQAEERLAYMQRQRKELQVTSPADGIVETIDLRPGDLVPASQTVATLLEPDQIWVRVYVPEPKLGLVKLGQAASITVDSYPKRSFRGKVVEIRTQAEYTPRNVQTIDQRADEVFGVKVEIEPRPELKPGMAALVTLATDTAAEADASAPRTLAESTPEGSR